MPKFTQKQISAQSGLSLATIDRAMHNRGRVHPQTQHRIKQALADLELQQKSSLAQGRTLYFDVIMHTPERFSELVKEAFSSQISSFASFKIQLRFHCSEEMTVEDVEGLLKKCSLSTHGIILKAMNSSQLVPVINNLIKQRIPVVTVVTDIPGSHRLGYIGMDNVSAGQSAAFLMSKWLGSEGGTIAAITGNKAFVGEQDRIRGFQQGMKSFSPQHHIKVIAGGSGIDHLMYETLQLFLQNHPHIDAVYTVGGGNAGILRALDERNIQPKVFVGHDLDRENRALMQAGKIDALIEHNLQLDAQHSFKTLLEFHGFLPEERNYAPYSRINIIMRYNMYI
ncbi:MULTISPECIES: substrate-binding domain-containing protein [unclassified Pantoea]|uniref:substrate-binding domain-containing protein n=1 Tax=unclassified Pantoea TaxID=2630326 RepID=UPI00247789EB|nr:MULTISPECIES: substrate-binding domain-containing protein [unclassified Pantoea]GME29358.1 LacI family DNA-binding transcriptional regulator [Pantoea sp. QMID3]GME29519.1 LacI family DNA-binding transcriptional regulator [Pantoea sp. QMID1]GME48988.1 LacI family DNA-binding transcriptional regulator [Pantoea sp. QMID4]GME49942.1 LacI family DNA-binding transcriptional regulator [Pantoea sp. QMID2]